MASAVVALAIGAISLRTSGMYFIMITLAFAQMLYYLGISLEEYGGDDGMRLSARSQFGGYSSTSREPVRSTTWCLPSSSCSCPGPAARGLALRHGAARGQFSDARARADDLSPYPYRLVAFVIAGCMGGLSGALPGEPDRYITPGLMAGPGPGEIMFMVILGGMELPSGRSSARSRFSWWRSCSRWTQHWQVILGPLLILSVIFFRRGLAGIFYKPDA